MKRLIESDGSGNWAVKGLPWKNLYEGQVITRDTWEKLYGCLCKLKDFEEGNLCHPCEYQNENIKADFKLRETDEEEKEAIRNAIKEFKERLTITDYKNNIPEYYKALELGVEALEKQIAKKPAYEGDSYAPDGSFVYDEWLCPNCGSRYEVDYDEYDYCPNSEMSEKNDYNKLFDELQKDCNRENCCNAFANITLADMIELNYLLDRLLIFCENIDTEELEEYECGDKVLELYKLADTLFDRDLS